jgi:proline dehydrogenase
VTPVDDPAGNGGPATSAGASEGAGAMDSSWGPAAAEDGGGVLPPAGLRLLSPLYRRAGSAYLVGRDRAGAIELAGRLLAAGSDVTLGYWPLKGEPLGSVTAEELATVEALAAHGSRSTVALKMPNLCFDSGAVKRLAARAAETGVRLAFDAHSPRDTDRTLELARAARAEGADVGVVLPSRWARSLRDAEQAAESGLWVRLVKGQWPDDVGGGGRSGEAALRSSFLAVLDRLLVSRVPVVVATHDAVLLQRALVRMSAAGVAGQAELLLGLPVGRALGVVVRCGAQVRYYIGFGHPGLPYPFTSVLRRPRLARNLTQGLILGARNQRIQQRAALPVRKTQA